MKLNESIFDDYDLIDVMVDDDIVSDDLDLSDLQLVEPIETQTSEEDIIPQPPMEENNGYATIIIELIKHEWDIITEYNNSLANLVDENAVAVIKEIVNEENKHIGMLQELLKEYSPNVETINDGQDKAEQMLNESLYDSHIITTIGDMIEGSIDNLNDDEIDRDLRIYNRVAKIFGFSMPDDVVVLVDTDEEYNPEYLDNAELIDYKRNVYVYDYHGKNCSLTLCVNKLNRYNYLFFKNEDDLNDYVNDVDTMYESYVDVPLEEDTKLSQQDKQELQKLIDVTDDGDLIGAFVKAKTEK